MISFHVFVLKSGPSQEEGRQCPSHANASHGDECYGDDAPDGQGAWLVVYGK